MKWSNEQITELRELCMSGTTNKEISKHFDVPISEVYAKRSQLGITRTKCALKGADQNSDVFLTQQLGISRVKREKSKSTELVASPQMERKQFVEDELAAIVRIVKLDFVRCEYLINPQLGEICKVWHRDGQYNIHVCIEADSLCAIVIDVMKALAYK